MSHAFVDQMMESNRAGELRSPVSETLDMHLVQFGRGEAVYEMPARPELGNPLGVIQGGVATALADAAMAAATTTILTDEEIQKSAITTIDIFARFIRPVNAKKIDRLRAEARWCGPVAGSCGPRPTCSRTARSSASSPRPAFASPSIPRPTS